jgi:NitT/TauT family transport system permease protein
MLMSVTTSNSAIARSRESVYNHDSALKNTQAQRSHFLPWRVPAVVLPWLLALVLLICWYISTSPGRINSLILPAPADVFSSLADGITSGLYLSNALVTVQESIFGFLLAVVVALPLGYGLAKSRFLAATFQPYLAAGQAIPAIVIAPILMLWLGYGTLPIILVCALVVLFPMVINTIFGIRSIDQTLTDAARVEGAIGWPMLAHIEFPLALPAILAAIRTCFTLSITGALVGEFVAGGDQGLGALVLIAKNQYNTPLMFSTLIVLAVLAAVYYGATWLLVKLADAVY